nr:immunoglobulin light chain junction region [Macaca mulatta]MOV76910.1 immunoglobulin light chain junction region [Macaca mulatta]MOY00432.1 immunoglobulin light chain junction region [Macaca mulatta]
CMQTRQTPYSF